MILAIQSGEPVPLYYSRALARRVGAVHAWSVDRKEATVFSKEEAATVRSSLLANYPQIEILPHGERQD